MERVNGSWQLRKSTSETKREMLFDVSKPRTKFINAFLNRLKRFECKCVFVRYTWISETVTERIRVSNAFEWRRNSTVYYSTLVIDCELENIRKARGKKRREQKEIRAAAALKSERAAQAYSKSPKVYSERKKKKKCGRRIKRWRVK